ncbi:hypothetical protein VB711_05220 [Cronbergia sp. UHCC 0137]|uniref:hypothetical protein n=1 Tax=Cronbergia sp. UHCC 0137 TaxID=3110239 RepID=UPI002B1F8352|nr:hypothetical protein [Cronbergia sp. UHCC 0137]MEA5617240.1 hypothetical protein [Cronbergia sp. UHCC 0137]
MWKQTLNSCLIAAVVITVPQAALAVPEKTYQFSNGSSIIQGVATPNPDNSNKNVQLTEISVKNTLLTVTKTNVTGVDCSQPSRAGLIVSTFQNNGTQSSNSFPNSTVHFNNTNLYTPIISQICQK